MIQLKNVFKEYQTSKEETVYALNDVSLTFDKEEFVSVLGPSGCGKSTLLNIIGGLDKPTKGELLVDNVSINQLRDSQIDIYRNQDVGFVLQNCFLIYQLSVIENIILPLKVQGADEKTCRKEALKLLERFHISKLKNKKVNQLSGGQAQKVAICRALISKPKMILADEPTGALDSKSSLEIMEVLKEISNDHLIIMVTHNEDLADSYSDRKIKILDGKIVEDKRINVKDKPLANSERKKSKRHSLSPLISLSMAIKNLLKKKWKSLITAFSNSLGVVGIGFFLALNNGFSIYSARLSSEQASSLPVVLSSYVLNWKSEEFEKINASVEYPDSQEIYPSISSQSTYSYQKNNFTGKYFNYLDKIEKQGILREYVLSYGSSYSFNLMTKVPESISSTSYTKAKRLSTSLLSDNYIASSSHLPTNIFHVLYGDLDSYDLIKGSLPTNKNELVLVVDKYNGVSFNILKSLGFYSDEVKEQDVKTQDEKKVKSISFSDVIGKEYKVFTNEEYYKKSESKVLEDQIVGDRELSFYEPDLNYQKENIYEDLYNSEKGINLKITGIIRAKPSTTIELLSPALCYSKQLQEELIKENEKTSFFNAYDSNFVFSPTDQTLTKEDFLNDLTTLYLSYKSDFEKEQTQFPVSKYNEIIRKYFKFYFPDKVESKDENGKFSTSIYYTTSISNYLNGAREHSASISENISLKDFSSAAEIEKNLLSIAEKLTSGEKEKIDEAYREFLSFSSLINAYSLIETIVLFPSSINDRITLLDMLDSYNVIEENSDEHASNDSEVIIYQQQNRNRMIEGVSEAISLTNMVLIVFASVSFLISISLTAFMISNNVLERKKEIGLLRSIGVSKFSVSSIFVLESLLIGFFSGIVGSIATFAFSFPLNDLINQTYTSYKVGNIANFTFSHSLIIVAIAVAVSFIASFIPAILASKQDPIKSLRSE